MSDYHEYEDMTLRVRIPSYLRSQKGTSIFVPGKRDKDRDIWLVSIILVSKGVYERAHDAVLTRYAKSTEYMGVITEVLRLGQTSGIRAGIEQVRKSSNTVTGEVQFDHQLIFESEGRFVKVLICGRRDFQRFEEVCKEIVSSVQIKEGGGKQLVEKTRRMGGGMKRLDKVRLSAALDGLPPQIAFLRKPILAIARQDQDLLGSGEADAGPIDQALRKNAKSTAMSVDAAAHADALHKWASGLADHNGAWASPIWFVEGFLRGATLFGMDNE